MDYNKSKTCKVTRNKTLDIAVYSTTDWFAFGAYIALSRNTDHGGLTFYLFLPFMNLDIEFRDNRHWDEQTSNWKQ